jgi:putative ABC transport system permease protein
MFDLDKWQEIWFTINKNRLRTAVTAFSVAWGIFILIILLGFGSGFQEGVRDQFQDDATNSIFMWAGQTSIPYKGLKANRQIVFTNDDYQAIKEKIKGVEYITGRFFVTGEFTVRYENKFSSFNVRSVHPDHQHIEKSIITSGRYINDRDILERRKVAVVGRDVLPILFGSQNPIGTYLSINNIKYKVVGVFRDDGSERENKVIYIPISTAQVAYGGGNKIHQMILTVGNASAFESMRIQDEIHALMAERHRFSKEDKKAVEMFNLLQEYQSTMAIFTAIKVFLGLVGMMTLVAGIIGVSNIMLIIVKERTREVGVRKAIGATPGSIVGLFLMEAMAITLLSGYLGMLMGMIFLQSGALTWLMLEFGFPEEFFGQPSIGAGTAIGATIILAFFGSLAGYFPARRASKIQPIEALRDE